MDIPLSYIWEEAKAAATRPRPRTPEPPVIRRTRGIEELSMNGSENRFMLATRLFKAIRRGLAVRFPLEKFVATIDYGSGAVPSMEEQQLAAEIETPLTAVQQSTESEPRLTLFDRLKDWMGRGFPDDETQPLLACLREMQATLQVHSDEYGWLDSLCTSIEWKCDELMRKFITSLE